MVSTTWFYTLRIIYDTYFSNPPWVYVFWGSLSLAGILFAWGVLKMLWSLFFWIGVLAIAGLAIYVVVGFFFGARETPLSFSPCDQSRIFYSPKNDVTFYGMEGLHPFDSAKYKRIAAVLKNTSIANPETYIEGDALEFVEIALKTIHTQEYLTEKLEDSHYVAKACELPFLGVVPISFLKSYLLTPMKYHVLTTMVAARQALKNREWTIALGGGMHHASSNSGGGWCIYSDIPIAIKNLQESTLVKNVLVIDLDAHQGNGIERDKLDGKIEHVFIVDVYGSSIYPGDSFAKKGINVDGGLNNWKGIDDTVYLSKVREVVRQAFEQFSPDIVFYNAGSDILEGDPLGKMNVTAKAMVERDEFVIRTCLTLNVPVVMTLSGGYVRDNWKFVATSIQNLIDTFPCKEGKRDSPRWKDF
jgi:histone deacetylase 11